MNKTDTLIENLQIEVNQQARTTETAIRKRPEIFNNLLKIWQVLLGIKGLTSNKARFLNWVNRKIFLDPENLQDDKLYMQGRTKESFDDVIVSAVADDRVKSTSSFRAFKASITVADKFNIDVLKCDSWASLQNDIKTARELEVSEARKNMLVSLSTLSKAVYASKDDAECIRVKSILNRTINRIHTHEVPATEVKTKTKTSKAG